MIRTLIFAIYLMFEFTMIFSQNSAATKLSCKMEELTAPRFSEAVKLAAGVCVIPIGILEKHGPHLPIGTDLILAREVAFKAAESEYAVVYPPYFFGQVFVAKAHPGAIAYSNELIWKLLEETCQELARNGLKKIILYNGHGGNTLFLKYFCQSQLSSKKNYIVVLFEGGDDPKLDKEIKSLKNSAVDGHAGEEETSMIYSFHPELVDSVMAANESGNDCDRLASMQYAFSAMYWYSRFPNHYAGDGHQFNDNLGKLLIQKENTQLGVLIRYLKKNNTLEQLHNEFYMKVKCIED